MEGDLSPAGDWVECGDRFYVNNTLYHMAWSDVRPEQMRVAAARFGGPIAMVRDEKKMVLVNSSTVRPVIKTFRAAGSPLGAFAWEHGRIVGMGWSSQEDLMVVEDTGEVRLYSMFGAKLGTQFSMGAECQADGVAECCLYGGGLVVLTATWALWAVTSLEEPRPQRLAALGVTDPPHCLALLEPRHTLSGCLEVVVAVGDSIVVVDGDAVHDQGIKAGPILRMAVAPNGQFLAGFSADGRLLVWLSDLSKALSELATEADDPPDQLTWCGTDSVVMHWEDEESILMVGPFGDTARFDVAPASVLVSEVDSVRIIGPSTHNLLRRLPDALVDVFRVGSTAPGAVLFDAREMFEAANPKADEMLRSIAAALPEAVETCVAAAGATLSWQTQAALMKAACYGRAFCQAGSFPKGRILEMCRLLRLLNALRKPDVGVPLTLAQLEALTLAVLVSRLVNARHHLLALRIATALHLSPDKVLMHWACARISAAGDTADGAVRDAVIAKLNGRGGIRYATIAAHAQSIGRTSLAAALLDYETCAAEQVPLLLSLGEEERGLVKAVESGDTDLVYLALFHMYRRLPLQQLLPAISSRPAARNLFRAYCLRQEPELLEQIYTFWGLSEGVADLRLRDALSVASASTASTSGGGAAGSRTPAADLATLEAARLLERASDLYAQTKEHTFQAKAAAEFAKLAKAQHELELETGQACFVGLSLAGTVAQCVALGNQRAAARLASDFKLSAKHFTWIKIRTLAAAKDWEGLEALAREKKSPVGFAPFVAACKANGALPGVTARFIARLPDGKAKAEEYASVGLFHEAAETAAQSKDSDMLSKIQSMVGQASPLGVAVAQIKDRLQAATRS